MENIILEGIFYYSGSSSNAVFRAPKKTVLEENRVRRGLFKYYLLIKRAPRISKVHFSGNFSDLGPCVMHQIEAIDT